MFELIFFIIIFYYAACYRKPPPGKEAIVRRNKEIFKTYRANQTFIINPFTDTVEFINPRSSAAAMNSNRSNSYPKVNYINPMNGSSSSKSNIQAQKGFKTYTINNIYTFRSLDGKPLTIKVYALFNSPTSTTIPTTALANDVKKEVLNYYTSLKADDISESATRHELTVFDILRRTVTTETIKLEKFEATPSNARITTRNTYDKTECTHYDERPTTRTSKRTDYSYSQGNAIKSSFSDTWNELNGDPISGESNSDNPIKETISINSIFEKNMIDVNNMDSNVDPIDNKY